MNIFITADRQYYRRWINILPTLFLAGSAQFLSGRKLVGLGWFFGNWIFTTVRIARLLTPPSSFTKHSFEWFGIAQVAFLLLIMADACRKPIRRIGFKGWLAVFGAFVLLIVTPMFLVRQFIVQPIKIPTGGMQPTLMGDITMKSGEVKGGDHVWVNKLVYETKEPTRGDVVVFNTTEVGHPSLPKNQYYVKRIIGIPGDTVSIQPPYVLIGGERLLDPPIFARISSATNGYSGYTFISIRGRRLKAYMSNTNDVVELKEDEYFVLGDNSQNSFDSRVFGPIPRKSIIGKAYYIFFPANRKGKIE